MKQEHRYLREKGDLLKTFHQAMPHYDNTLRERLTKQHFVGDKL